MAERPRLGVLATHPIQYHAPLFRALAARDDVELTVFFAHRPSAAEQGAGFGIPFEWDVDLTAGYRHEWLRNVSARPSVTDFGGCDTPEIGAAVDRHRLSALLVMGWHSRSYLQGVAAALRRRIPVIVRGDSILQPHAPLGKRVLKRSLYPLFVRRFAACLSVGTRSEEYFRHYGARRVLRAPHFVDNAFFAVRAAELRGGSGRVEARSAWRIPPEVPAYLFAGKFIPQKRVDTFVQALAIAAAHSGRPLVGLFVGDGALRQAAEAQARRLGVDARFVGFLNQREMPRAYAAADALVLPSASETWGMVVNEAMASGLPTFVSSSVGCAPDLITEGETGRTFQAGDAVGLAKLLASAAASPSQLGAMGARAARAVLAFSADAAAEGVVQATRLVARATR